MQEMVPSTAEAQALACTTDSRIVHAGHISKHGVRGNEQ
jgi:hypothetical protein